MLSQPTQMNKKNCLIKQENGQALVIVVLVVLIALTIGVSVSSQTIISSRQAVNEEQSAQAYAVAEAGAEKALYQLKSCSGNGCYDPGNGTIDSAQYEYTITPSGVVPNYNNIYESRVEKDKVTQVNLTSLSISVNTPIKIYWWSPDSSRGSEADQGVCDADPDLASIEVTYLAKDASGGYTIRQKLAFDGCATRASNNKFTTPSIGQQVGDYDYSYYARNVLLPDYTLELDPSDQERLIRIRAWYEDTWVAVVIPNLAPGEFFPNQGYEIVSIGKSSTLQRKIRVTKSQPYLPEIFDYVIFSGGSLEK